MRIAIMVAGYLIGSGVKFDDKGMLVLVVIGIVIAAIPDVAEALAIPRTWRGPN